MTQALSTRDGDIRLRLTFPVTNFKAGPFAFDPVKAALGAPLSELLEPILVGQIERGCSSQGVGVDHYPVALPLGEGLSLPVLHWGAFGFFNANGLLLLTVPQQFESQAVARCSQDLVRGPERRPAATGGGTNSLLWVDLKPGSKISYPLGFLGELGIEVT